MSVLLSPKPVLLDFCHEILHEILINLPPADLSAVSRSCRSLYSYIKGNRLLWRDIYIRKFDDPPRNSLEEELNFEEELKKIVPFQKILESKDVNVKRSAIAETCNVAIHLLKTASAVPDTSRTIPLLDKYFEDRDNANVFLFSSELYKYAGSEDQRAGTTEEDRQAAAKLHCYYGTSKEAMGRTRSAAAHPFARARVYDLRRYKDENLWGPFMDDGSLRTDWEKIESLMIVLGYNLQLFAERCPSPAIKALMIWHQAFEGVTPNSYTPLKKSTENLNKELNSLSGNSIIPQPEPPLEAMDPYGISGTWRRVVCFLDYNDLYAFNFAYQINAGTPRPPLTTQEAIRLITMQLRIERLEAPREDDGQSLPVAHFTGSARSMHQSWDPNANSRLRVKGTVRLTPEGEVRWTTLSLFGGEARWRSESIQVGGLRSARGVIGTWFDKDFDPNGPAGPTAFWKLNDDVGDDCENGCELVSYTGLGR